MSKSSQQPPAPPDPSVVAAQTTGSNINTAIANKALNLTDVYNPLSSTTYTQNGSTNVGGVNVPTYAENTTYSPMVQSLLTGAENLQSTGQDIQGKTQGIAENSLLPTATTLAGETSAATKPLDFNSTNNSFVQGGPVGVNQAGANAAYGTSKSFLDPQWNQQQMDLTDQLSHQGLKPGDDAYERAMTNFNNSKNQAYSVAQNNAITTGSQIGSNMFNMALQGQNQNVGQQQLAQQNPIQLLAQLYGTGTMGA